MINEILIRVGCVFVAVMFTMGVQAVFGGAGLAAVLGGLVTYFLIALCEDKGIL